MENHPIPQDVTGFQFKLIGNMTVKQFAYLATGIVLAWILLQLPITLLIKIPLCTFLALFGISLAYLPIGGRPMDAMIGNYIKALFRPTQFVYEKSGTSFAREPLATQTTLQPTNTGSSNKIDERENSFLKSVSNMAIPPSPSLQLNQPIPTEIPVPQPPPPPPPPVMTAPIPAVQHEATRQPLIRPSGFTMPSAPDTPNIITGMTKDPRGNPLPNILVEVKDRDGHPVRAFKTNELGRFASATPLMNGVYTVEFEDSKSQNKFEVKTINVNGQIIMPLEAISIDTREELRRSLFSNS